MKLLTFVAGLFFTSWVLLPAQEAQQAGKSPDKLLEELRTELRTELRSGLEKNNDDNDGRLIRLESAIVEMLPAGNLEKNNEAQTLRALIQIRTLTRSEKVEALSKELSEAIRNATQKRQKDFKDNYTTTLVNALRTGFKATKPSELDAPLLTASRLAKEANSFVSNSGDRLNLVGTDQAVAVQSLLTQMQDLLLAAQAGRLTTERMDTTVSGYGNALSELLPRSEIMEGLQAIRARANPAAGKRPTTAEIDGRIRDIIRGVTKLEDLAGAVQQLDAVIGQARESNITYNDPVAISTFRLYRKTYEEMKTGLAATLSLTNAPNYSGNIPMEDLASIRGMLIRYGLPQVLGLAPEQAPKENETTAAYLGRIAEEARKAMDWALLNRTIETARSIDAAILYTANDLQALRLLMGAANFERARRPESAVACYLAALKTGSLAVPAEWIGEKLAAIEKMDPVAYAAGSTGQAIAEADGRFTPQYTRPSEPALSVPARSPRPVNP